MTFAEIQTEVAEHCNVTSTTGLARIGRSINVRNRRVVSALGLKTSKQSTVTIASVAATALLTVPNFVKVTRVTVFTDGVGKEPLDELVWDRIREKAQPASDSVTAWAVKAIFGAAVILEFDVTFASTAVQLRIDGWAITGTLSGSDVPSFNQDFHDTLVWGAKADELLKMKDLDESTHCEKMFEKRLSDLRLNNAVGVYVENTRQNGRNAESS